MLKIKQANKTSEFRQCLGVRLFSPFGDMCQTRHCDYGSSNEHPFAFALHDSTHGLQCIFLALNPSSIDMRRFQVKHTCTHDIILIFLRFVSYCLKAFVVLTRGLKECLFLLQKKSTALLCMRCIECQGTHMPLEWAAKRLTQRCTIQFLRP